MSSSAEVLTHEDGPFPAPHNYRLGPGEAFRPTSICVFWDGSGAGGDFLPCCSFYSKDGKLLGRSFPGKIAAGDSVRVTYSPFALSPGGADLTDVVRFNLSPQPSGFLEVDTSSGITMFDNSGIGFYFEEDGNGGMTLVQAGAAQMLLINNGGGDLILEGNPGNVVFRNPRTGPSLGGAPGVPSGFILFVGQGPAYPFMWVPFYNALF